MNKQLPIPGIPAKLRPNPSSVKGFKRDNPEDREQSQLFHFLRLYRRFEPRFAVIHASLNGLFLTGKTKEKAVRTGMEEGVWDVFLPLVGHWEGREYAGMYLEMKIPPNKLTTAQERFRDATDGQFVFVVASDWLTAARAIVGFLSVTDSAITEAIK